MKERKKELLQAVYEDKFVKFLKSIGVYERVINGEAKCKFCGNPVTIDNINAVFPENKEIKFACDSTICIAKMSQYLSQK